MEANQSLDGVLKRVEELGRDLSAVVQVGERELWHYEDETVLSTDPHGGGASTDRAIIEVPTGRQIKISDGYEPLTEPDTPKRENARVQLQQLYDSSEWYSARYGAGNALGIPNEELKSQLKKWKAELGLGLNAMASGEPYVPPYRYPGDGCMALDQDTYPDTEKREKSRIDLDKLELLTRPKSNSIKREESSKPGSIRDYVAPLILTAAAVAAAGLGVYKFVQYLRKE